MKVLILPSGQRVSLSHVALWGVEEPGRVTLTLAGTEQCIEVATGLTEAVAQGVATLIDHTALAREEGAFLDIGEALARFGEGCYVSQDLKRSRA